ncbi:uncharacterized protein EI97DRAFT_97061 [Westerdykella ornata]|uniref:MYND-type domain-containing protein n=1 Tax=Westerdykella ornata TaxID=318751 RepID=A0A6A6JGE4_WESOR|nr:uncharacterized protein EI97DRAFT_97061 [Westerdykella ornata]KAF2274696.1 hypothetical protein EI97DRAFT_97061 [Westerdykella ornata]
MTLFWKIMPRKYLPLLDKLQKRERKEQDGEGKRDADWKEVEERANAGELDERMKQLGLDRGSMMNFIAEANKPSIFGSEVTPEYAEAAKALSTHDGQFIFHFAMEKQLPGLMEKHPEAAEEIRELFMGIESIEDVGMLFASILRPDLASALQQLVQLQRSVEKDGLDIFQAQHLIRPLSSQELPPGVADLQYYKISPMLTIALRAQNAWLEDEALVNSCRVAHTLLYARRCWNWPAPTPYSSNSAAAEARIVSNLEFYNIAAAVSAGQLIFDKTSRGFIIEDCVATLIMDIEWGLVSDSTRVPAVQMLWEESLQGLEKQMKELEKSPKRPVRLNKVQSMLYSILQQDNELTDEQFQVEMHLSSRRRACLGLSVALLKFYTHVDDQRRNKHRDSIRYIVKALKNDTHPVIKETTDKLIPLMDFAQHYADSTVGWFPFSLKATQAKLSNIVQDELIPAFTAERRLSFDAKDPEQVAARLQNMSQFSTIAQFNETIVKIWEEHGAGRHDEALRLLESMLKHETDYGQNDPGRRSTLLFMRCIITYKQERFTDALRDLEESQRLYDISNTTSSFAPWRRFMGLMRRFLVWQVRMEAKSSVKLTMVPCSGCGVARGTRRCIGCLYVGYCSSKCQKKDWKEHKKICKSIFSGYCI